MNSDTTRPNTVFISSRMAELKFDRIVAYRAIYANGYWPILFEREPRVNRDTTSSGIRLNDLDRTVENMILTTEKFLGLYYLKPGEPASFDLRPIEFELIGFLAKFVVHNDKVKWNELMTRIEKTKKEDRLGFITTEIIEKIDLANIQTKVLLMVKTRENIERTCEEDDDRRISTEDRKDWMSEWFEGTIIGGLLLHPDLQRFVQLYYRTDSLFKIVHQHAMFRASSELIDQSDKDISRYKLTIKGNDRKGLLRDLCFVAFRDGVNLDWLNQSAMNDEFLMACVISKYMWRDDEVEDWVKSLKQSVPDIEIVGPINIPSEWIESLFRIELKLTDTPGMLYEISKVLSKHNLNVEDIYTSYAEQVGADKKDMYITVSSNHGNNRNFWAQLDNELSSIIGVYSMEVRNWRKIDPRKRNG